jgi:hypothetical protein
MFPLALTLAAPAPAAPVDLTATAAALHHTVESLTPETCGPALEGVFTDLARLTPRDVDLAAAIQHREALLDGLFATRLELDAKLAAFHEDGALDEACVTGARRTDLATRYLADHLYMLDQQVSAELGVAPIAPWQTTAAFTGIDDLQGGDLLVTRGDALSSAGIAHIGRIDSQFSHNAMVHVDAEGRKWTVEAYLEKGALVQPLEDFLEHGLGRIAVVRFEDPALAARGAALAYDRIANGDPIDYDEAFDGSDADELFCSEIGPWALRLAGGPTDVPLHPTRFPVADNPRMFAAMGIEVDMLSAPVDVLVDPRFTLVGEWRSVPHLEEMRRQDAVVESLFRWMEEDDYALDPTWGNRAFVDVGLTLRRTPGLGRLVQNMVHPHGDRRFLIAGLALQQAGETLYADFDDAIAGLDATADGGFLTRDEMLALLDDLRERDLAVWSEKPRKAGFHRVLHPTW